MLMLMNDTKEAPPQNVRPENEAVATGLPLKVIAVLAVAAALWWARVIVIPLVLGILGSYALDPIQRRLTSWGLPRAIGAALIVIAVVGGLGGLVYSLRHQATAFVGELPGITQRMRRLFEDGRASSDTPVAQVQQAAEELKKAAEASTAPPARGVTRVRVEEPGIRLTDLLWRGSVGVAELAAQATIVLAIVYYLLASGDLYKRKLVKLAGPSLAQKRLTVEILNHVTSQIERFLLARILVSAIVGVATGVAFWLLGVSQPAMWGLGAGVLNTIPYLGPAAFAAAAAAAGFVQFGTAGMALLLASVAVGIATIEGVLIAPWLMGRASNMNTGAVFVGLSFWGWIWGVWGMLLAVPILISIKAIGDHIEAWRPVSELLGE
jgi:predicted PurR-regulated permease PerM